MDTNILKQYKSIKKIICYRTLSQPHPNQCQELTSHEEWRSLEHCLMVSLFVVMKVCMDSEKGGGGGVKSLFGRESRTQGGLPSWVSGRTVLWTHIFSER